MTNGNQFRIYPTKEQQATLLRWIGHQRFVYNAKVQEDRYFRAFKRKFPAMVSEEIPIDQQYSHFKAEAEFLKEVPSQLLRNGAYRWRMAQSRYEKGANKGRPKIRKKNGRQSVLITAELFQIERTATKKGEIVLLHLGTKRFPLGAIPVNAHRKFEGVPKMIYVSVDGGRWHVSFSLDDGKPEESEFEIAERLCALGAEALYERTIGNDLGTVINAASSAGHKFEYSKIQKERIKRAEKYRRRWQRIAARRQKGSARQKKAQTKAARCQRYGVNVRDDVAHKASRELVDMPDAELYVFEDLNIKNMTKAAKGTKESPGRNVRQKAGLNRSILESGWGKIKQFTKYKARREGKLAISVPAHYSSQECRKCGFTAKDNRQTQAEFVCQSCGHAENADFNASGVIRRRGVKALVAGEIKFKKPKKCGFRSKSGLDNPTQNARGEVLRRKGRKPSAHTLKNLEETPTTTFTSLV